MDHATALIRWIIEYALSGGFWHFVAVFLIVRAITGITTLFRVSLTHKVEKGKGDK